MNATIGALHLQSPILLGSCDLFVDAAAVRRFSGPHIGAVILKTTTREATTGYPRPHVALPGPGAVLVASGMANPGIDAMCRLVRDLPDVPLMGSVATPDLAADYAEAGVLAVELNLSCPHTPGGVVPAHDPVLVAAAVRRAKQDCPVPVIAKLTGWHCDIVRTAVAAQQAGADAISLSNLFPGVGYYTGLVPHAHPYRVGEPLLGNVVGAYTGASFLFGVLHMIACVRREVDLPLIATGGCCSSVDALAQTAIAGASAVATVTPLYQGADLASLYHDYLNWSRTHGY